MSDETPRHRLGRIARVLVGATATLAIVVGAFSAYAMVSYLGARDDGIVPVFGDGDDPTQEISVGPCVEEVCNYLLLGSDSRKGLTPEEQEQFGTDENNGNVFRSDTIMLVQLDPRREKAVVLSFPRDLWVEIPGRGEDRINTSFEGGVDGGGPLGVARTIHRLTGLKVNHFLYVDLLGFQRVVDTLGGVEMCIPFDVQDPLSALDLKAGCQTLDGRQALGYVRTRHLPCDDAAPDLSRIGRQQQFLRAVINQLLTPQEFVRAPGLVQPVLASLKRDEDLTIADRVHLVVCLQGISTGAVDFRAVPATPDTVLPPGFTSEISVLRADPSAQAIFRSLRNGTALPDVGTELINTPTSPANIPVAVLDDASGDVAGQVEDILSTSGFDVSPGILPFADAGIRVDGPAIVYTRGHSEEAQVVAQYLPGAELHEVARSSAPWDVAVISTAGYQPDTLGSGGGSEPECIQPD
jgi:LCP family protein required for cell wall assembly